ncbi:MAG: ABC transporter substrate-binding protein [Blastocatellia bacterium]
MFPTTPLNCRRSAQWIRLTVVLFAALVTFAGSCNRPKKDAEADINIGYSRLRISIPVFVAQEKGIFQKHGIKANLVVYDTAQPMMQALVEGKTALAGYTALPITYSGMLRSGTKLLFLTLMVEDQKHRISYLVRKKTVSGIKPEIGTIADLKGKRIGILPTIAYKAWLEAILKANGVDPSGVVIQNIEPALEVQALQSGGVDALFTNDPPATAALATGVGELITDYDEVPRYLGDPFPFGSFNVRKDWADAHPNEFQGVAAALDEAVEYANAHPDESKDILRKYLPEAFKPQANLYADAKYLPSYDTTQSMFDDAAKSYVKMNILSSPIDLSGLIYMASKPKETALNVVR